MLKTKTEIAVYDTYCLILYYIHLFYFYEIKNMWNPYINLKKAIFSVFYGVLYVHNSSYKILYIYNLTLSELKLITFICFILSSCFFVNIKHIICYVKYSEKSNESKSCLNIVWLKFFLFILFFLFSAVIWYGPNKCYSFFGLLLIKNRDHIIQIHST